MEVVQIKEINGSYLDGWLPIEDNVNEWLSQNDITPQRLIKVTKHFESVSTAYPPPNDKRQVLYALVYYTKQQLIDEVHQMD